jgi:sugar lactone lactonase YvrE
MKKHWLLLSFLVVSIPVTAQDDTLPDEILMERPDFSPEGIEYDAEAGHFLVSSLAEGTVFAVDDDGTLTPFAEDEALVSSVGLEIDEAGGRLLVANSDRGIFSGETGATAAGVGIFDLESGNLIQYVDLMALAPDDQHFINDLTVDADGNIYATDSFSPMLFKIDTTGEASIFLEDERLFYDFVGLNGIEYHPDGYLLAGGSGILYKIPLDDPANMTEVETDMNFVGDGLVFDPEGRLIAVIANTVMAFESSDDWVSAEVVDISTGHSASTATIREGEVYAVYPHFGDTAPVEVYEIVRVNFGE